MKTKETAIDYIDTSIGKIPIVPSSLNFKDKLDAWKVRWTIGRMKYMIEPGLYAIGNPTADSPVFVSANYKLSFDSLRKVLPDISAWILVLDTKGINVWCAAGKGTFGTDELIGKIKDTNLHQIMNHRRLIVPQLGAPGVAAHLVKEATDFKVLYGPIRAVDLKSFIESGYKASPAMRQARFNMLDRLKVIPVEVVQGFKYTVLLSIVFFLLSGFNSTGYSVAKIFSSGFIPAICIVLAFIAGTVLTPLLLPFIPGRAFSLKGFNIIIPIFILIYSFSTSFQELHVVEKVAWFLLMTSISSFFAMNFTGASTFTSLSGVKKEMRFAVPLQIFSFVSGFILWIIGRFI
jgi:hypothetical protein